MKNPGNTNPKHHNLRLANTELFWSGTDSLSTYKENIKNTNSRDYLNAHGWLDNDKAIVYRYNSHGFRSNEFDQTPSYLALGCSFTEGIGLPLNQTWPSLLSEKISSNVWNLGVSGVGLDVCFRFLDYYLNELNILGVFVLLPNINRFELHTTRGMIWVNPHWESNDANELLIKKLWYSHDHNSYYNRRKNVLAMERLCQVKGIKFFTRECSDLETNPPSRARDMRHDGYSGHIQVSDLFHRDFNCSR